MSHHLASRALEHVLEAASLNRAQARALFDRSTPEPTSFAEVLLADLNSLAAEPQVISRLLRDVGKIIELGDKQRREQMFAASLLDSLARAEHAADRQHDATAVRQALTFRGLVRALRPALATIEADEDPTAVIQARREVHRLIAAYPQDMLTGAKLRHELRGRRHDLLLRLMRESVPAAHGVRAAA